MQRLAKEKKRYIHKRWDAGESGKQRSLGMMGHARGSKRELMRLTCKDEEEEGKVAKKI